MLDFLDREQSRQYKRIERLEKYDNLGPMEFVPGTANPI